MRADAAVRRRLRLGALLYRLGYYAVADRRDEQGRIVLYRYDATQFVELVDSEVRFVSGDAVETLDLEAAIVRCKAALSGAPLHGPAE